jgi:hypothetical protein
VAHRWYSSLFLYGLAIAGVFALDALAFRSDAYRRYLEPESYAGQVEQMLRRASGTKPGAVLVLGDSRMAEGFSAKVANQHSMRRFVSAAVPGSTPRCWYYFLRWMPPEVRKGATIVIPLDDYADEDGAWDWADRALDNSMLAARLSLSELPEYTLSFRGFRERTSAALTGLFRGSALRQDLQAFLSAPEQRLEKVEAFRTSGVEWAYDYSGNPADLQGLRVDWERRRIAYPDSLPQPQRESIHASLFRTRLPQTGRYREYRLHWFRKISLLARESGARAVFVRVPRGPVPLPAGGGRDDTAVAVLVREGIGSAAPEDYFAALERPEYFFDALHMNQSGRMRFTTELAEYLSSTRKGNS